MQFQSILAVFALTIAASAAPAPEAVPNSSPAPTCNNNQTLACCDSIQSGTGVGCVFSTLNVLNPTCAGSQSLACCNSNQVGLVNIQCVPVSVAV